ncbi:MAG: class I SAM-dependent methyltransferase [Verrucomicrobiota bacterium]
MPLYDFLAPAYDLAFERIYSPFREQALAHLEVAPGACVLDLACGTGQNFPLLAGRLGPRGRIVGVDISVGMLRRALRRSRALADAPRIAFLRADAAELDAALLEERAGVRAVDAVVCTYGFTTMRHWETAFRASWKLLRPGGAYLIHDIDAARHTLHVRAVELATHSHFTHRVWRPLKNVSTGFRMEYFDPSAYLFGGRLFVAWGTKSG